MTDAPAPAPWLDSVNAYARLARLRAPIGFLLLLWPCWWAVAVTWPDPVEGARLMVLFLIGAVSMRAAGCVWNDIIDRDFDAKVARTAARPIASGRIPVSHAAIFMAVLSAIGLAVLLQLNATAIWIGLASLLLIAPYPFMKRITWWPQAWLGITFNWGALVAWAAATGTIGAPALALYAAGIAWTLGYDTIYAHQDKEDDALIGVKSSARRLGDRTKPALWLFYSLTVIGLSATAALAGLAWPAFGAIAIGAVQLAWQIVSLDADDPANCLVRFRSNNWFAAIVFVGFFLG